MEAAAVAAAHRILVNVYPAQQAVFDASYVQSLSAIPEARERQTASPWRNGADQITQLRLMIIHRCVTYTPGTDPGDWRPTRRLLRLRFSPIGRWSPAGTAIRNSYSHLPNGSRQRGIHGCV